MSSDDPEASSSSEEGGSQLETARRERHELQRRMERIKEDVAADVEANWPAMWRSPELVDAKVRARLSGHEQYQELLHRVREMESREADLGGEHGDASESTGT